jgi:hypothetical protein
MDADLYIDNCPAQKTNILVKLKAASQIAKDMSSCVRQNKIRVFRVDSRPIQNTVIYKLLGGKLC